MQGNVPFIQWDSLSWKFYKPNTFISKWKTKAPNAKGQMVTFGWRIKEDDSDTNIPIWQAQYGLWLNTRSIVQADL